MDRVQGVEVGWLTIDVLRSSRFTPYELDLCEQLGVTPDEYWEFIIAAQEYVAERGKEYELFPTFEERSLQQRWQLLAWLSGLPVRQSVFSSPEAGKPKDDRRANLEIGGREGRTRYSRATDFDGIQQLASLGKTIPLVFARQQNIGDENFGGVRVETDMLFSQMISNGGGQLLYTLLSLHVRAWRAA